MRFPQLLILLFLLFSYGCALAQLELSPIARTPDPATTPSARTQATSPKKLPFWDDFSFPKKNGYAQDSLWRYGQSVFVNNGMAINPPSLGVATFDGLDSLGKPYSVNDVLAKGYADKLVSVPLPTNLIASSLRPNVFFTFYYQFQGRGEAPDQGDILTLLFKNDKGKWETIWTVNNDGTLSKDVFKKIIIPVTDSRFFHSDFQFMFRNFARLSAPYDTWNLDYVFFSNGEVSDKPKPFPDRTITSSLSSLFKDFTAIPIAHFMTAPGSFLIKPSISISNLRLDSDGQPMSYFTDAKITTRKKKQNLITTYPLDEDVSVGNAVLYNESRTLTLNTIPNASAFDSDADSISLKLSIRFKTDDNTIQQTIVHPDGSITEQGDYVPRVYSPVDFRINDTTSTIFTLHNYYAYDDGTAEYGAGLNQAGAQVMYRFDLLTNKPDTLVGFKVFFPRFGDETSQIIQVKVLRDLEGGAASLLYQQSITVQRTEHNQFTLVKFDRYVGVSTTFYLGWQQNSSAKIPVGLDKNTDSGNKVYFNVNGTWQQDVDFKGSLMIRPIFGKGGIIVGFDEKTLAQAPYPNPNKGVFFLSNVAEHISIIDLTGREISFREEIAGEQKRIQLNSPLAGIYIVRYYEDGRAVAAKFIVQD